MKTKLLFIFCFFWILSSVSQNYIEDDEARGAKMMEFFYKGYPYIYTEKDSAYFYLEKAMKVTDPSKDHEVRLSILDWLVTTSSYHYDLPNYSNFLDRADTILKADSIEFNLSNYQAQKEIFSLNRGRYYFKLADYNRAQPYFKKLSDRYESISMNDHTPKSVEKYVSFNNYLATIYRDKGKYDLAEQYYLKTGALINSFYTNEVEGPYQKASNEQLLAALYNRTGKYQKANTLLRKSLPVYTEGIKKNANLKNSVNAIFQKLVENQLKQDSVTQALNTLNESQQYLSDDDPFHRKAQLLYGDIYLKKEDYRQSKVFYDKALESYKMYRNNEPHEDVANVFLKLAILEKEKGNSTKSLDYIQQALINATNDFSKIEISLSPEVNDAFSKRQLLTILSEKLSVLYLKGEQDEIAFSTSKKIIETLDVLKTEFESKLDKAFLIEGTYPVFQKIIKGAFDAHQRTNDDKYLELAFLAMEKSKSILLLETLKETEATQFGQIPDSVLNIGQQSRANITFLEKKLVDAETEDRLAISDSLFKLNKDYISYLERLENEYPKYYQLKYDNKTSTIKDTQEFLDGDETLINFHIADTTLYTIVISKKENSFFEIPFKQDLKKKVELLYRKIASPSLEGDAELRNLSYEVYAKILEPCLKNTDGQKLVIIPDGILSYIPFGVLSKNKESWEYLIDDYGIHYVSSATLMTNPFMTTKNKKANKLLALAPTFESTSLYNLPFSQNEIEQVASHFNATTLSGSEATLASFNSINNEYGLVHLATHASANDEFPDYSFLAFTPDAENENRLYVKDLYNQTINANMVTLSACQTGIGKLQKGEGLLSIERGFMYAGAKSLTTTMWKNNDKTTSQLMNLYYGFLKKGDAKDEAMQKAKKEYLATATDDLLKHPYYWAGFKVIGDNSPVSSSGKWWYWVLGIVVILIITRLTKPTLFKLIE